MNFTRKAQKPFVLSLMVGLMFLLTACPGGDGNGVPPTANNDQYSVATGGTLEVSADDGVLANDQGEDLEATLVANAAGTLTLNDDGSFTYTATGVAGTTDTFTYTASNDAGTSTAATVTINITGNGGGGDVQPVAQDDAYEVELDENGAYTVEVPGVLGNDTGGNLEAALASSVANGTLALNADGSFTYTPNADFVGTDSFTYTASNDAGESEAATVTLTAAEPITELDAVDDALSFDPVEPTTFTAEELTENDDVPTGAAPVVTVDAITTGGGAVTDNGGGSFTYTPPPGATEGTTDSFTYTLSADGLESDTATVNVTLAEEPVPGEGPYDVNFQSQPGEGTPPAPAPPAGYLADYGQPFGVREGTNQTYGWVALNAEGVATDTPCNIIGNGRYRTVGGAGIDVEDVAGDVEVLYQTFMHMEAEEAAQLAGGSFDGVAQNCAWEIAVPNGTYSVTLALGDAARDSNPNVRDATEYQVSVEGNSFPAAPYDLSVESGGGGSNGSESLFITTEETDGPLTVEVTDGRLTITPTGTNTKIAFVNIAQATTTTP